MKKILLLILIMTGAAGIFFWSGCSASSNSLRYHQEKKPAEETNTAVRFSSEKEEQAKETSNDIYSDDTTNISEDSLDAEADTDDIPANEKSIDISSLLKKYSSNNSKDNLTADKSSLREKVLMEIIKYLNTPYKYGGSSKNGIDCSAFTQAVYDNALAVQLDRTARDQYHEGEAIRDRENLEFGDLVFFNTRRRVRPGHVGIYIGDNLFAHASSRHGVIVSSLDDPYYSKRFMGGRRIDNLVGFGRLVGSSLK